jgi:hypothetical protein
LGAGGISAHRSRASRPGRPGRPGRWVVGRGFSQPTVTGLPEDLLRRVQARLEALRLLALGPAFQFRLAGAVTAAWAADTRARERATRRPELTAALTGRVAPAVAEWIGISPDAVTVTPLEDSHQQRPPWGSVEALGTGSSRLVRASLPVGWLASVWACGLAVVGGHLVVAVEEPGWPRARVLALPEPGAAPVSLDVTGTDDAPIPHWHPVAPKPSSLGRCVVKPLPSSTLFDDLAAASSAAAITSPVPPGHIRPLAM